MEMGDKVRGSVCVRGPILGTDQFDVCGNSYQLLKNMSRVDTSDRF